MKQPAIAKIAGHYSAILTEIIFGTIISSLAVAWSLYIPAEINKPIIAHCPFGRQIESGRRGNAALPRGA